jgi:pyruvate dehydrogenase (quinone)/pyruvate oxidase
MLMAEFDTAVRYQLPVKVVVNNNAELGQIMWEQMVLGYPEFGVRFGHQIDFAAFARACGGLGIRVEKGRDLETAVARAFAHPGPAVIEAVVDPNEPPLPGKITTEQALHFTKALVKGEKDRFEIIKTVLADKVREVV